MNKKTYYLFTCIFFLFSVTNCHAITKRRHTLYKIIKKKEKKSCRWGKYFQGLITSIATSSLTGSITGAVAKLISKKLQKELNCSFVTTLIIVSILESDARTRLLRSFQEEMKECNIPFKAQLMNNCAWLTSWISYLYVDQLNYTL